MTRRFWTSLSGGILIPILYYGMVATLFAISAGTIGEQWEELLLLPLFWPGNLLCMLFSGSYQGDFFADFPMTFLLVTVIANVALYTALTYIVLKLRAKRRRLA